MQSPGYTSLPGGWQQERRRSVVTWGAYQIPAVPLACSLLIITGLPMWAAGMLQARATTDSIFKDLGVAADSVDRLKAAVLTAVLLLSPLVAVVLGLNVWLEASRAARPGHTETGLSLSHYTSSSTKTWLLADLNSKLQEAVRSLSIAVAGALLLLVGQSVLFGYLAGQAVHAARDLEDLLKQGDGMLVVGGAAAGRSSMAEA
ncbi:hypothetical protein OEZ85_003169 [Tetradesmus obliquus]|uniref:ABC transmembrane type-1 domain-containing protein n=1 Tax=Tetradesmus obliquus TaxID=3088 RepID=A0ABY8U098_TETOB|nr:hypothetical protein OEZ85_003169 [Tetradesmus obliquus]